MIKRALFALAGFLALQSPALALPPSPVFDTSLFNQPSFNSPWSSLESRDRFFFATTFGSAPATSSYLPAFDPSFGTDYTPGDPKDAVTRTVQLRPQDRIYYGGEIGFLYGKSTGSGFGREDYAGFITGTIGNDKFSLTVGYYRQETNFSGGRFRR